MTAAAEIQPYRTSARAGAAPALSQSTAVEQQRAIAEVQAAVVVAQSCPRDMAEAEAEMEYVCGRLDMAEQAFYQVTNRGTGPSVHLARELARIWGNIDYGVKELHRDDERGVSEVLAFAWDVQKNSRSSRTFINPHARMARGSRVELTDLQDIYLSNQNIGARAVRETIFTIIPRWFTEKAQDICRRTLEHGEGEPLKDRISKMVDWFGGMGISVAQLQARVDRPRGQWTAGDVAQFKIAGKSIMAGEAQKDELFPPVASSTADEITGDPEPDSGQGGENEQGEGAEPSSGTDLPHPPADPPKTEEPESKPAPGAPTEATPGQTDRVNKALSNARKGGMSAVTRSALIDDITDRLNSAGCNNEDDRLTVIRSVLELGGGPVVPLDGIADTDLTKIRDTLHAWQQVGTSEEMVGRIIDTAALNAESKDGS